MSNLAIDKDALQIYLIELQKQKKNPPKKKPNKKN